MLGSVLLRLESPLTRTKKPRGICPFFLFNGKENYFPVHTFWEVVILRVEPSKDFHKCRLLNNETFHPIHSNTLNYPPSSKQRNNGTPLEHK